VVVEDDLRESRGSMRSEDCFDEAVSWDIMKVFKGVWLNH
jgi:hypothetical protein